MNFTEPFQVNTVILLVGIYSVVCLLLLSRLIKAVAFKHEKVTQEDILDVLHSPFIPKATIIVPDADNCSVEKVFSLMSLQYGNYELVLVIDRSLILLSELTNEFQLKNEPIKPQIFSVDSPYKVYRSERPGYRRLLVIEKKRTSLGASLNAALNASSGQFIAIVKGNATVFRSGLVKLLKPFLTYGHNVIATAAAVRIRPVDNKSSTFALRNIRNFVLGAQGNSPVATIEAFSEGVGMLSRYDLMKAEGFSLGATDTVRDMLFKLYAERIVKGEETRMVYIPEVLVHNDHGSSSSYSVVDQFRSYITVLLDRLNFKVAIRMLPVCFPGIVYFLLLGMMVMLVLAGPLTGQFTVGGSIAFFAAGYTFLVFTSICALLFELRYSTLRYSRREVAKLLAASFILPFRIHLPARV